MSVYMFAWQETGYLIVSDQDFYAQTLQSQHPMPGCPLSPSPASGLVCPPPFPHPSGARLIIVRIPIRGIGGGLIYCTFDIYALSGADSLSPHPQLSRALAKKLVSK